MLQDSAQYKTSDETTQKQASFAALLYLQLSVVKQIWQKHIWANPRFMYIDLHGGPGIDENGDNGSPLVFYHIARHLSIPYDAIIYEADEKTYKSLEKHCGDLMVMDVRHADNHTLIQDPVFSTIKNNQYGLVYSDPSNAELSLDVLRHMSIVRPKMDIAINIAATTYKRIMKSHGTLDRLTVELEKIKPHWLIREPHGQFQWSILFGTAWVNFPAWKAKGFEPITSELGRSWWLKIGYTKQEIKEMRQPKLPGFRWLTYNEYLASPVFKSIRAIAMQDANRHCQYNDCGRYATEVHHLKYSDWFKGQPDNINNLLPVCHQCHCEIHGKDD